MGRPAQPEIRLALLEEATDYALEHGLPDSLEPFARATGASSRMLLYHFGTRDRLMRAVLERARERQVDEWSAILQGSDGMPYTDSLAEVWATMTGPTGRAYLRMFGQLRESSEQRLWPGFRRLATTDWLGPIEAGLRTMGRPELATLVLGVIRGLVMDLEATGDQERVDRAFRQFLDLVDGKA